MIQINDVFPDINPAFCSLVLASFCKGYCEEAKEGVDFPSLLIVLPMVLSNDFEHFFYQKRRKSDFFKIVSQHPDILLTVQSRIKGAVQITQQGICFALSNKLFFLNEHNKFMITQNVIKKLESRTINTRIRKYINYADMLGLWLGKINSSETIFAYIGAIQA